MELIQSIFSPQESVNDEFLSVISVRVKTGDKITSTTLLAELETSKAIVEVHSNKDGYVKVHIKEGTDVKVGSLIFEVYNSEIKDSDPPVSEHILKSDVKSNSINITTRFSKAALDYISKNNLDRNIFTGSSFITTKDLIKKDVSTDPNRKSSKEINPSKTNLLSTELKPISSAKKREFDYLYSVNSSSVISRIGTSIKIPSKKNIETAQVFIKTTPLPSIIHEVGKLLIKYPNLNSYYSNGEQAFYKEVNVGFALDDGINGLKVASILNTDKLSLKEIEETIADISLKYTNQKLTAQELSSSTFTITDLFATGISNFHPLVNANNSAILGISGFENFQFNIDVSFDHRISNGREVSAFLSDLKYRLEHRFNSNKIAEDHQIHCMKCFRDLKEDMNGSIFFQKVINSKGEGYICSNCLIGF